MTPSPSSSTPPAEKDIKFREFVLLCACLMAMNALSIDPMLPALPDIGRDLNIPHPNDRQLIISMYFLGLGIGSLLFGILSDRFGRKRVLGSAMALFILATVACAGAHSFAMMLIGRMCAGFFAGASRVITVGIIRDRFRGDAMAQVMSLIFAVFILIPVMAPSMGQAILWIAPWRWIFWALALLAAMILPWMMLRLPETLKPENRIAISARTVLRGVGGVITHRSSIGYMLASGVAMGGLLSFILSVQQILFDTFDARAIFPLAFAVIAGSMGVGSLINSRLVSRFGARRLSQGALIASILVCTVHVGFIEAGWESLAAFMVLQSLAMLAIAFTASNFSAISMEPFSKGAGIASSFQAFLTTAVSATLGSLVGRAFDGTVLPLALGMVCFGCVALAIIAWAERGRLFTRPGHDALRDVEF
ncbi:MULTISPECIES: multidrug effflux MFS transporter [Sphingobium]|uniref:DHA1 family bicyclomycin/chloramphenicol resistance-like MFS transporter n=1 Tax=Sphingobium wenxiniae (strain DSM 21828 / CGMCC 1.7748 / JZ-1) TaxID=595605 RepID=A0A562KEB5_SPHWJ|nr:MULTISPECIES: multidrug effflux MFS transporter [Sphingobium]KMS61817.1 major facilitator transporter [Sphingobium baderi LL03]TWH93746.1 DHA1 family bicyclomycin/chloramphenicol resistance-like MFS transporter [Sphingobium wenxiniae]WRD75644.1 multidrug effflux MFS transporter [Sphingobium baderi]